ncbi:hypothetical protein PUN28_001351 [Cardiocondyla obscurior]|uniref:Uncharacterized protein n=1 Tax=Cardiocondyla obscurior TaxID=286306 RepID=A0AAW2H4J4_9HYME
MAKATSTATYIKIHKNEEENFFKENEYEWLSDSKSSQAINETISMRVKSTPNKVANPMNFIDTNCMYVTQTNLFVSPLLKSPLKNIDNTLVETCLQRNSMINTNSNGNTLKLELSDTKHVNKFENIDLLHDLDSMVTFDNNIVLSSTMDINTMEDNLLGVNKDPMKDPLSISDCEKQDSDVPADLAKVDKNKTKKKLKVGITKKSKCQFKKDILSKNKKAQHLFKELKNSEELKPLPLRDIKKLLRLHINLIHKVPPQHKIELSGSHPPNKQEKILFFKYRPIRKGAYTPKEDTIIKENWKMFCELHDWDEKKPKPFLCWRHNGMYYIHDLRERQKFVQFLANGLPSRTLYSVYSRFKILYRNKITRVRYTFEEDKKILTYMQDTELNNRVRKFSELAKILKRTNRSVLLRYQYLKKKYFETEEEVQRLVDIKWTLPLIRKFIKNLLNITLSEDIMELKDAMLPKPIWQKLEEKLNINHNVLKTFWQNQLHLQLFSTDPIYLNDIKIQLIEYMYAKGISSTREIIWSNVAKLFDGATAVFLCRTFFYLVQECKMTNVDNFASKKTFKLYL